MNNNETSLITDQVLRGLSGNRRPGWNFPGNFLQFSFDQIEMNRSLVSMTAGPHLSGQGRRPELAALTVLADMGMATSLRKQLGPAGRMATVQMSISFTRDPDIGDQLDAGDHTDLIEACSTAEGETSAAGPRQLFTRTVLRQGGRICCVGSAAFMPLGDKGMAAMLLARRGEPGFDATLLTEGELDETEAGVLARARQVLAGGHENFLARFWDLVPEAGERRASCTLKNGLHSGNRVGHTQGGIVLALAGHTCLSAVGEDWDLASISGWYLAPGRGPALHAHAEIQHRGNSTASCRCQIKDEEGRLVMHAVSSHVRRATAANMPLA